MRTSISRGGGNEYQKAPSDYTGIVTPWETDDQSTTRAEPAQQPVAGAKVVSIHFIDIGSSTADSLYVVFNAINDADAAAKLAVAGLRYVVALGERRTWTVPANGLITRIDYLTESAETGENKVAGEYVI